MVPLFGHLLAGVPKQVVREHLVDDVPGVTNFEGTPAGVGFLGWVEAPSPQHRSGSTTAVAARDALLCPPPHSFTRDDPSGKIPTGSSPLRLPQSS